MNGLIYYYSINNKVYKYTRVRKYDDNEDYRCSCTACKAKDNYVSSLKKFIIQNDHIEYENHSYVITLLMKDRILKNEITKKNLDNDEKILNYFRGYFNLYNASAINAKILFSEKFGISLSNNLLKGIGVLHLI